MSKATLNDWVWVEAAILQSALGVIPRAVYAVGLSERGDEWIITCFTSQALPEDEKSDLIEIPAEAEEALQEFSQIEGIATTSASLKPLRMEIVVGDHVLIRDLVPARVDRLIMAWNPQGL